MTDAATSGGVLQFIHEQGVHQQLAILNHSLDDAARARPCVLAWLRPLPRQIEVWLQERAAAGVIRPADETALTRASIRMKDRYRQLLDE